MAWLDSQGNYYEGDRANLADRGVPARPSAIHIFVDGAWIEDPVQAAAIAAEAARIEAKRQAIIDNLPSWIQVSNAVDAISDLSSAKVFIKKLARIVYWLAKDKED